MFLECVCAHPRADVCFYDVFAHIRKADVCFYNVFAHIRRADVCFYDVFAHIRRLKLEFCLIILVSAPPPRKRWKEVPNE